MILCILIIEVIHASDRARQTSDFVLFKPVDAYPKRKEMVLKMTRQAILISTLLFAALIPSAMASFCTDVASSIKDPATEAAIRGLKKFIEVASGKDNYFRSYSNTPEHYEAGETGVYGSEKFHQLLDSEKLLETSFTFADYPDDPYVDNLVKSHASIGEDMRAPVLDADEIRHRQEALQEYRAEFQFASSTVGKKIAKWCEWNEGFYLGESMQAILNYNPTHYVRRDGESHVKQTLAIIHHFLDLPKAMEEIAELLKDAKSTRLKQTAYLAEILSTDPELRASLLTLRRSVGPHLYSNSGKARLTNDGYTKVLQAIRGISRAKLLQIVFVADQLHRLYALDKLVEQRGWKTYPEVLDRAAMGSPFIQITKGHVPRLMRENPETSTPNSVLLGAPSPTTLVITGPNDQGKTTYMRMTAQLLLLAQLGVPVPAESMRFTPMGIYFHINPLDNPSRNIGTFGNQGKELWQNVVHRLQADPFLLILLDEILSGTTWENRAAAEAEFLFYIADFKPAVMVTTHNWPTADAVESDPRFQLLYARRWTIQPGRASAAEMVAGAAETLRRQSEWPDELVERVRIRAKKILEDSARFQRPE